MKLRKIAKSRIKEPDCVKWIAENNISNRYQILFFEKDSKSNSVILDIKFNREFEIKFSKFKSILKNSNFTKEFVLTKQERFEKMKQTNLKKYGKEFIVSPTIKGSFKPFKEKEINLINNFIIENNLQNRYEIIKYHNDKPGKIITINDLIYNRTFELKSNYFMKNLLKSNFTVDFNLTNKEIGNKRVINNIKKYGVSSPTKLDEIKEKIQKTNLEKYGAISSLQNEDVKIKSKNTKLNKYGVENMMLLEETKKKCKETNLERYGTEWGFQSTEVKVKIKKTNIDRYGFDNAMKSLETQTKMFDTKKK